MKSDDGIAQQLAEMDALISGTLQPTGYFAVQQAIESIDRAIAMAIGAPALGAFTAADLASRELLDMMLNAESVPERVAHATPDIAHVEAPFLGRWYGAGLRLRDRAHRQSWPDRPPPEQEDRIIDFLSTTLAKHLLGRIELLRVATLEQRRKAGQKGGRATGKVTKQDYESRAADTCKAARALLAERFYSPADLVRVLVGRGHGTAPTVRKRLRIAGLYPEEKKRKRS